MKTIEIKQVKVSEVVFREDLYPRFEPDWTIIERYKLSLGNLPAIEINQDNILIDGYHRLKAHELAGEGTIDAKVTEATEEEVYDLAMERNATHGFQPSDAEKRRYAIDRIEEYGTAKVAKILSVTPQTVRNWTANQRKVLKEKRDRDIERLYLRGWNSMRDVADILDCSIGTVSNLFKNEKFSDLNIKPNDFCAHPINLNHWRYPADENTGRDRLPQDVIEQMLNYFTEPLDLVFAPFAGTGTIVDACKKWKRRYWVSDINPIPGREEDIREYDITNGIPKGLGKHKMTFLDPPSWKNERGMYTDKDIDLSNMDLDSFLDTIEMIAKEVNSEILILVMSSYQEYSDDFFMPDGNFCSHRGQYEYFHLSYLCWKRIKKYKKPYCDFQIPYPKWIYSEEDEEKVRKGKRPLLDLSRDINVFVKDSETIKNYIYPKIKKFILEIPSTK